MSDHVLRGRDGWLFLGEGTNYSISQMTGALKVEPRVQMQWRRAIELRREVFGDRTLTVVCPEKSCVYPHRLPEGVSIWPGRFSQVLERDFDSVLYPFGHGGPKQRRRLYSRTDTHFTQYGAHVVARQICRRLGIDPQPLDVAWSPRPEFGDLGAALDPRERSNNWVMQNAPRMRVRANGLRNRGRVVRYESQGGQSCHVLVFGDSFSGIALAEQLAHVAGTVTFVHSLAFDYELALRVDADFVVGEMAERFLIEPPGEGRSLAALVMEKRLQGLYAPAMLEEFHRTFETFREIYGPAAALLEK